MEQNKFSVLEKIVKNIATTNVNSDAEANVEVEGGEKLLPPNEGKVFDVEGKKHKDGGVKMNLESGTLVLSDYSKIKEGKKYIEDKYDVNIKKDTFSSVLKKIENKIGLTKIDNEIVDLTKKLEKNEKVEDENTKNLNLQALSEKLTSLNRLKERKEAIKTEAFQELYNIQEAQKENEKYFEDKNGIKVKFEDGGQVMFRRQDIPILREKYGNVDLVAKFQELKKGGKLTSYKQGGKVVENGVQYMQQAGRVGSIGDELSQKYNNWRAVQKARTEDEFNRYYKQEIGPSGQIYYSPNYEYNPRGNEQIVERGKYLARQWGIPESELSKYNANNIGELYGRMQQATLQQEPELATDYAIRRMPITYQGIQKYVKGNDDKSKAFNKYLEENLDEGIVKKLKGATRGSFEQSFTPEDRKQLQAAVQGFASTNPQFKEDYVKDSFYDKKGYIRGVVRDEMVFTDEKEFNDWIAQNKDKKVGSKGYYDTGKDGVYLKPVLLRKRTFDTLAEKEAWEKSKQASDKYTGFRQFSDNIYEIPEVPTQEPTPKKVVETPSDVAKTSEVGDFQTYKRKPRQQYMLPSVRTYAPSALQLSTLLVPEMRDATFTKVSPELALRENNRSLDIMGRQLENTGDTSVLAGFSDLAGKMFSANNEAVSRANEMNMQSRVNYDNLMSQRSDAQENTRLGTLGQNEKLNQQAWLNTSNDWRDYYKQRDLNEIGMFRDMASINMAEAMTPDQNYNPFTGQLTATLYQFNPNQYSQLQRMMNQAIEENNKKTTKK